LEHGLFFRAKIQLESFEAAAMPHLTDLHRTASFLLRDPHEAEDLIQETYLEAWKSFHRFELGTNCRAWLFNLFNIVNMGLPANIIEGTGFGMISKTAGTSRQIQFSLKLIY
jgi:hypothetical protein